MAAKKLKEKKDWQKLFSCLNKKYTGKNIMKINKFSSHNTKFSKDNKF